LISVVSIIRFDLIGIMTALIWYPEILSLRLSFKLLINIVLIEYNLRKNRVLFLLVDGNFGVKKKQAISFVFVTTTVFELKPVTNITVF
jgi:hypothetical protein